MVLFVVALGMYAIPLLILNSQAKQIDEDLFESLTGFDPLDAMLRQYQEVLAGFSPTQFDESPVLTNYTVLIFLCATFFT